MKLGRNRRLANFTKSAVAIGILLPRVPLHYHCLSYTLVVPFLALTLQRSAVIRNTDRPKLFFLTFFRNGTNPDATKITQMSHVCRTYSRIARRNANSRRGKRLHTIYRSLTTGTVDVNVFAFKPNKREIMDDLAEQKKSQATMTLHSDAT